MPSDSDLNTLDLAKHHGLALEVANQGSLHIEKYQQANIPITAVQAYEMHDFHPLHRDLERRSQALPHVIDTLELAAKLNATRIVTVCGFGNDIADQPMQRCLDFFDACVSRAKALGIRIMIEPLSPKRCAAMTQPEQIAQLIKTLNEPDVFSLMLDTGHLSDSGIELNSFFQHWNEPIEALQLKGPSSTPPSAKIPLIQWINTLPALPAVISVEHRQAIAPPAFRHLIEALQLALQSHTITHESNP